MIFDISNLLYRSFYAKRADGDDETDGLAAHIVLTTLSMYVRKFNPAKIVIAFDRSSWRKDYTSSDVCLSRRPYKGHRREGMTEAEKQKYMRFLGQCRELETLLTEFSTIITLACEKLEADDLIAGFVQKHCDSSCLVLSADSDLLQLVKNPNVDVYSPMSDKYQTLEKFDNSAEYFLFEKCIRGDASDNIRSAFPRVRATRLKKAFADPYEMTALMKEEWTDENQVTNSVQDLYDENRLLMDLEAQPEEIRQLIDQTIEQSMSASRKFVMFHFMKYLGKHKLNKIAERFDQYVTILSR